MGEKRKIALTVNGKRYEEQEVEVRVTLADFVRHQLGLTGTHLGCEHGVCGACTILFDGRSARSCLMLAVQADGHDLLTVKVSRLLRTSCTRCSKPFTSTTGCNAASALRGFSRR
jgi:carbon-monoxide dehydrogenase small subunit